MPERTNCYDYPQYWDLAFRSETKLEADFIEAACTKYCNFPAKRLLEPGCGGGRLVVEMSARGYEVTGFDLSEPSIKYLTKRLARRKLGARAIAADMTTFVSRRQFDAAFCTFNTFRHLTTEDMARQHLECVAQSLRPGGIYILGFHLLPPDADEDCIERWSARHGKTKVTMTLRVLDFDRNKRLETIRFSLRVRTGSRDLKLQSDYQYRIYTAAQFQRLLISVPQFELCDVYDFWYDIEEPFQLSNELGDAVFVLRKRS
ncbi:MAG: class I SAM-dependent methyltransferase [Planctomycetaceae bacterium]|nr:class I SAM-dependent methyltransferase [Planctomycetales bacterium]MCB9926858.1 class I SAM-dependent methyltransferase [Planctomycetaceae bacterium]